MSNEQLTFEVYDINGTVTRQGSFLTDKLSIGVGANDYKIVLKDLLGKVVQECYLKSNQIVSSNSMPYGLCAKRSIFNSIEFYCNSFLSGHTHIGYYNVKEPDHITELELIGPDVSLTDIPDGDYAFYTRNDAGEKSDVLYLAIANESVEESIDRLKIYLVNPTDTHEIVLQAALERLKHASGISLFDALVMVYNAIQRPNSEQLNACYDLITISEYIENQRILLLNQSTNTSLNVINDPQPKIAVNGDITKVFIQRIVGTQKRCDKVLNVENGKTYPLSLLPGYRYLIEAYHSNKLVGSYPHYEADVVTKSKAWQIIINERSKIDEVAQQFVLLPPAYNIFTEDEMQYIQIEKAKNPIVPIVSQPEIELNKSSVAVTINDFDLIKALGRTINFVIKEPETIFRNDVERKIPIDASTFTIDMLSHCLFKDENYYMYLQDDQKNLLSNIKLISMSDDETIADYREKVRQMNINTYKKDLLNYAQARCADMIDPLKAIFDQALNTPDLDNTNIYKFIIMQLSSNRYVDYFNTCANMIYEHKSNYGPTSGSFFPRVYRDVLLHKLTFPPRNSQYILQVDSFNLNDTDIATRYIHSGLGAIELDYTDHDYNIYQAIDIETYQKSGYILVCNLSKSLSVNNWNIDVEVV